MKPQRPKWLTNNEKPQKGQLSMSECGMGTNGTGDPRKLEENVRDDGSVTLLRVAKGRQSEVSTRNGHKRMHRNKRKPKRRSRGKKKPMMGKNKSITVLPPLSPLLPMRQTTPAIMMNEGGGGEVT